MLLPHPDPLYPFHAIHGFQFLFCGMAHEIRCGVYPNGFGRGAMSIFEVDRGEQRPLTVNMAREFPLRELEAGEFCVRWAGSTGVLYDEMLQHVAMLGIFHDTGRRLDAGYVDSYAAVWRFAVCGSDGHARRGDLVVGCPDCRAEYERRFVAELEKRDAWDSARRLENQ